ncbi:MAG: MGMT family protein [Bacteroidia bacterium]|nr:MGMT family protein [Bacteroidia bacterium]
MDKQSVRKASSKIKTGSSDSFFEKVHAVARKIPYGRVTSYGAIAKHLGSARSARMVGWAMNQSHLANPPVPAHRVLNRNGMLTGKHHFGFSDLMQQLLESEGIRVEDDCVVDFEKVFWEPEKSSKLKVQRKR